MPNIHVAIEAELFTTVNEIHIALNFSSLKYNYMLLYLIIDSTKGLVIILQSFCWGSNEFISTFTIRP